MNDTALLERPTWHAHVQLRKFTAAQERDAMHVLHPRRAILLERAERTGFAGRLPRLLRPAVECDQMLALGLLPFAVEEFEHNLLCNAGINRLESLLIGAGGQAYDATHSAVCVGDGNGTVPTAAATDTDLTALTGATHRYIKLPDATYPSAATQVVTWQGTVPTGSGNFEWREWGISGDTVDGGTGAVAAPLLNHKGVDLGLKTSAAAWALKVTITLS